MNRSRSMSPKRSASPKSSGRAASPKSSGRAASPKSSGRAASPAPIRKTQLDKVFEGKKYEQIIQWVLIIAVFAVYIVCLVLYLTNYTAVRDAVETHFDFTSSFIYKPWFVILFLTLSMLGMLYVIRHVQSFILPVLVLFVTILVFFTLSFVFVYNKTPTQKSATAQIMAVIGFIALVIFTLMIIPFSKKPLFSLVCLIPTYLLVVVGIYMGGVLNRTWIA
jgi:hypothetical protein